MQYRNRDYAAKTRSYYESARALSDFTPHSFLNAVEENLIETYFCPPPALVLDIACGSGRTTKALADLGYNVIGTDISFNLIDQATKAYSDICFMQMEADKLSFEDNSFDGILLSSQAIDHLFPLPARSCCMHDIFRVLRPGGIFIFSTHNYVGELLNPFHDGKSPLKIKDSIQKLRWMLRKPLLPLWYMRQYVDNHELIGYAGPPWKTKKQLLDAGFQIREISGVALAPNWGIIPTKHAFLRGVFAYFAAEKPLSHN